jgi:hypothetical protein
MRHVVYALYDGATREVVYVGMTSDLSGRERARGHDRIVVLERCETRKLAFAREKWWIRAFHDSGSRLGNAIVAQGRLSVEPGVTTSDRNVAIEDSGWKNASVRLRPSELAQLDELVRQRSAETRSNMSRQVICRAAVLDGLEKEAIEEQLADPDGHVRIRITEQAP